MRDHLRRFCRLAKELVTYVLAVLGLVGLVLAVDGFIHDLLQRTVVIFRQQPVPAGTPDNLDDIPAGAEKCRLEFLDNLAVAAHRPIESLQVAIDDKDEVIEVLAHGHRDGPHRLRLVHFPVTEKRPDLAIRRLNQFSVLEVAHEARLIDRHHRPQPHGDGRELPELRHEPRMRIGRQSAPAHFTAEAVQLVLAEPTLEVCTCVYAGGRVPLEKHHIAEVLRARGAPEMIETDFVKRRRRRVARDMSAEFGADTIRLNHHCHGVPAQVSLQSPLECAIPRVFRLPGCRDRIQVSRIRAVRQICPGTPGIVDHAIEEEVRPIRPMLGQNGVD